MPREVGAALLASAEGYTPRATQLIEAARERLGTIQEIAGALADDLPAPKTGPSRTRRRRKRKQAQGRRRPQHGSRGRRRRRRRTARRPSRSRRAERRQQARRSATATPKPRRGGGARRRRSRRSGNDGRDGAVRPARTMVPCSFVLLGIGFLAGVITAISPCVLPVLPILLAGGATGRRPAVRDRRRPRRQLRRLHPLRRVAARQARPAEGPAAEPRDRAALPRGGRRCIFPPVAPRGSSGRSRGARAP